MPSPRKRVVSLGAERKKRAERWEYTAANAAPLILKEFDQMARAQALPERWERAELERRNRKRI
jgi:hypothetical protein